MLIKQISYHTGFSVPASFTAPSVKRSGMTPEHSAQVHSKTSYFKSKARRGVCLRKTGSSSNSSIVGRYKANVLR